MRVRILLRISTQPQCSKIASIRYGAKTRYLKHPIKRPVRHANFHIHAAKFALLRILGNCFKIPFHTRTPERQLYTGIPKRRYFL